MAKFECQNDHHYMPEGKWQNQNLAWHTGEIISGVLRNDVPEMCHSKGGQVKDVSQSFVFI